MDKVVDLLEGGVGVFPAVGNDGPGGREQGEDELVARFSLMKQNSHCSIVLPKQV